MASSWCATYWVKFLILSFYSISRVLWQSTSQAWTPRLGSTKDGESCSGIKRCDWLGQYDGLQHPLHYGTHYRYFLLEQAASQ